MPEGTKQEIKLYVILLLGVLISKSHFCINFCRSGLLSVHMLLLCYEFFYSLFWKKIIIFWNPKIFPCIFQKFQSHFLVCLATFKIKFDFNFCSFFHSHLVVYLKKNKFVGFKKTYYTFFDTSPSYEAWETDRYLKNRLCIVRARGGGLLDHPYFFISELCTR